MPTENSSLGFALLGLLAREPLSGYDLSQSLSRRMGWYWTARHSQIYPELKKLQKRGHVTFKKVEQQGRPDKKVYSITTAGKRALADWVVAPFEEAQPREEMLLRTYSMWLVPPARALEQVKAHQTRLEELLGRYDEVETRLRKKYGDDLEDPSKPGFGGYATLKYGVMQRREQVAWCRWMIETLSGETGRAKRSKQ